MRRVAAGLPLILVLSFVLLPGCGNDSKSTGGGDVVPPAAVLDLAPVAVTDSSLILVWTAPGDDDSSGTATRYDIRYSTFPDSMPDWWDSLSAALDSVPIPRPAGGTESLLVGGLEADTTYSFALRSSDEVPNWSNLSNIARVTCEAASPGTDTIPPGRVTDLAVLSIAQTAIAFTWTSPGDDGASGTADHYDIRYSVDALDEGGWGAAIVAPGVPTPQSAGFTETFTISGLAPDTSYSFGVRALDDADNMSGLSNIVITRISVSGDAIPPARIPYLYAAARGLGRVFLAWSAPGDDGTSGRAARYDIRHSETPIDEETWPEATRVSSVPIPSPAGTLDSMTIGGVPRGWRRFALRAFDEMSNGSPISDVALVDVQSGPPDSTDTTDTVPPATITDLEVSRVTEVMVVLAWTAPGGDGTDGTASLYEVRRASSLIELEEWEAAQVIPGGPLPQAAGSRETLIIDELDASRTHYFAVRAMDGSGNRSGVSNIVNATLPSLLVEPDTLSFASEDTARIVTLRCVGDGPLHVRIRTDRPWLSADPAELDVVDQEGTDVIVRVDRAGLAPNLYSGSLRILTRENADTVVASMTCGTGLVIGRVYELADIDLHHEDEYAVAPKGVAGARVAIGPFETTTDDTGHYALWGLDAGVYPLQVTAPLYAGIDSMVPVATPQVIDVRLDPFRVDYFSLETGHRFEYRFDDYRYEMDEEVWYQSRRSGTETWVVQDRTIDAGDTVFAITVHGEGVSQSTGSEEIPIQYDREIELRLSGNRIYGEFPSGMLVRRYYPSYSADSLAILGARQAGVPLGHGRSMWMMRGVGPTYWRRDGRGTWSGYEQYHQLLNWSFEK